MKIFINKAVGVINLILFALAILGVFSSQPEANEISPLWLSGLIMFMAVVWGATALFFFRVRIRGSSLSSKLMFRLNIYVIVVWFGLLIHHRTTLTYGPFITNEMVKMTLFAIVVLLPNLLNIFLIHKSKGLQSSPEKTE